MPHIIVNHDGVENHFDDVEKATRYIYKAMGATKEALSLTTTISELVRTNPVYETHPLTVNLNLNSNG